MELKLQQPIWSLCTQTTLSHFSTFYALYIKLSISLYMAMCLCVQGTWQSSIHTQVFLYLFSLV